MAFQPYVPPEQLIKDRSDYARKGISRGKSVVAMEYADGILFLAENPSATLHKISEILWRVALGFSARNRIPSAYSIATTDFPREMPLRA